MHSGLAVWSQLSRRTWLEWLLVTGLVLGLTIGLARSDLAHTLSNQTFDQFMRIQAAMSGAPQPLEGVLIRIDEKSLETIGRWPWPRQVHAQLLRQIASSQPRVVALDILLTESQADDEGDLQLAAAIAALPVPVLLPVTREQIGPRLKAALPISAYRLPNVRLAHIRLPIDSDGTVRRLYLHEGFADASERFPHLSLAIAQVLGTERAVQGEAVLSDEGLWIAQDQHVIRYFDNVPGWVEVSYLDVLAGKVPADLFQGKAVLIGTTALGLSDAYPTPDNAQSGLTPGARIVAQVVTNLRSASVRNAGITVAPRLVEGAANLLLVLTLMALLLTLQPVLGLLATLTMITLTVVSSAALFIWAGLWLDPFAALVGMAFAFPLWSWRRLEAALSTIQAEARRLAAQPDVLPEHYTATERAVDLLDQRLATLMRAGRRLRDLRRFLADCLEELPDAAWIVTVNGQVLMHNRDATLLATRLVAAPSDIHSVLREFSPVLAPNQLDVLPGEPFAWHRLLTFPLADPFISGVEAVGPMGRTVLVKTAQLNDARDLSEAVIVSVIDLTVIRQLEAQREQALRFLSHDIRSPQASILALLDTHAGSDADPLLQRIRSHANSTLALAESFVQLARAETGDSYRMQAQDLAALAQDAADEVWALARHAQVRVMVEVPDEPVWIDADRSMVSRAIVNLLTNAIKFSPPGKDVHLQVGVDVASVAVSITDQGPGIAAELQPRLFMRFSQLPTTQRRPGVGLGLALVKAVADRHHAQIRLDSAAGQGSCFTLVFAPSQSVMPEA